MQADHLSRRLVSHVLGYCRTPIAALDAISGIAQTIHENDQRLRHALRAPASSCGRSGESKARKRRNDDVECRTVAVRRMCKRLDHCEKFNHRTGPAVNQQQRDCIGAGRALVDKINLLSINFCRELVKAVDLGFLPAPVEAVLPIIRQFSNLLDVGAVLPCRARNLIGPSGFCQTVAKIDERLVRNMHFERTNYVRLCRRLRLSQCDRRKQEQDGQHQPPALQGRLFRSLASIFHHALTFHADRD